MSGDYVLTVLRDDLVAAIEVELKDYFFDGVSPTLPQYAVDHIIGCIMQRVAPQPFPAFVDSEQIQTTSRERR